MLKLQYLTIIVTSQYSVCECKYRIFRIVIIINNLQMGNEHQKQQKIQEHQQRQAQLQQQQAAERQKQQEATKNQQMQVKSEQTVYSLNSQILNIDDLIRKKEAESQRLEARAKELITQGKKIEAKKLVG
jgi:hypothetical protein